jgi:hypothetical protein
MPKDKPQLWVCLHEATHAQRIAQSPTHQLESLFKDDKLKVWFQPPVETAKTVGPIFCIDAVEDTSVASYSMRIAVSQLQKGFGTVQRKR